MQNVFCDSTFMKRGGDQRPLAPSGLFAQIKLTMKLVTILLLVFVIQGSAATNAQTITLSLKNVPLKTVFKEISRQGGYNFVYNDHLLQNADKVDIEVNNVQVEEVLKLCFRHQPVTYEIIDKTIIVRKPENHTNMVSEKPIQPTVTIRGRVTDEKGDPLIGVTIQVKGTATGTVSKDNGEFQISAPDNASGVLVLSFMGMEKQEVLIGKSQYVTVVMKRLVAQQQEVVVVGYGTQKKSTLTGSVAMMKGEEMAKVPSANVSNAFAGHIPGVIANNRSGRPGDDNSSLYIRGFNSFSGGVDPLILIDGIPDRNIDRLNPNDIESVTVLKDASAAIYGVRSANGAILVTTKRGKAGKPQISYEGSYALQQLTRMEHRVNSWQYMTYYNELNGYNGSTLPYTQADIDKYKAGNDPNYTSTDWQKAVFRKNAPQTNHSLSVRGGSEAVKFFISGQYLSQQSNWANSDENFKNYNLRSNIDASVSKNLKLTFDIAARKEERQYPAISANSILHETVSMYPFIPVHWTNGLPSAGIANGRNPYLMTSSQTGYDNVTDLFVQPKVGFDWQLPAVLKGLSVSGYMAFDYRLRSEKIFTRPWDAYSFSLNTNTYNNQRSSTAILSLTQDERIYNENTYFYKVAFDRSFGKHTINAFLGYEQTTSTFKRTLASRKNLVSDQLDQLFAGSAVDQIGTGSATQDGRESYLGRLSYSYADKYLAEIVGRYNGSFNFPKGKQWGMFPSASLGWRISEENFFRENIHFVDNLKLRASWGIMGSDAVAKYLYLARYSLVSNMSSDYWSAPKEYYTYFGPNYSEATALYLASVPNIDITWEKQDTRNFGLDAVFLNNKLSVTADYFRNLRKDILAPRNASVPYYSGMTLPDENIGRTLNRGFDFIVNYSSSLRDVKYNVGVNFTYAKSKVIFKDEAPNIPDYQKTTGLPIGSWLVYQTKGIYRTKEEVASSPHMAGAAPGDLWIVDKNGDGNITSDDQVRIPESAYPQVVFGVTMGASYKGLSLDLVWAGQTMAKQLILPQMQGSIVAPPQWLYNDRWTPDNPDAVYPRAFNSKDPRNSVYADFWLMDASFIRLKSAQLSYMIPKSVYGRIGIENIRVFVSGFNLFSIDHMRKFNRDPETDNVTGISYPQTRVYRAGISIGL
ncbi:TonB-linked SusC/RagA family outer membrane protein [Chitinophaga dinghuensis]|uniref:TonB-linked SusC/RagA family outer membrane protein n=2 Tax=Chitinophaga dinghuensis TaxID=1539050 RepID=A0A327WB80_9BACT|nr:TonB-linked SusC/RagA family outer membrane protein [Chitinophaga dinghuensis]